jgi:phage replication O-like protein O
VASPQLEDGYFRIANEIAEALMRTNLSGYQSRILWAIFRKTYGYGKKEDWISNSQFVELTGLQKGHVSRAVKELRERSIVTKRGNKISFNKDYQQWRELPKGVTTHHQLPNEVTPLPKGVSKVTKGGGHKRKQYTKDSMRDSPNPAVTEFIGHFSKLFSERFGELYTGSKKKERDLVQALLKNHSSERLKELAKDFFESNDPFIKKAGHTIGVFHSQINKLISQKKAIQPVGGQTQDFFQKMEEAEANAIKGSPQGFRPDFFKEESDDDPAAS